MLMGCKVKVLVVVISILILVTSGCHSEGGISMLWVLIVSVRCYVEMQGGSDDGLGAT